MRLSVVNTIKKSPAARTRRGLPINAEAEDYPPGIHSDNVTRLNARPKRGS